MSGPHAFPVTRASAVAGVASDDPAERARAFDILVRAYWKPVYKHLRLRWSRSASDAGDLTQAFFARAFERGHLKAFDPSRARFRTYLKGSLDNFVRESSRADHRQKRGGDAVMLSLDFDAVEQELARTQAAGSPVEAAFDAEWTRGLFTAAAVAFERVCETRGKTAELEVFRRYVLEAEDRPERKLSYSALGELLGLSVTDVTNYLAWGRRQFRALLLEALRDVTASDDEFRSEARALFGVDP